MKIFAFSVAAVAFAAPVEDSFDIVPTIIGGVPAEQGEFPWQISQRRGTLETPGSHMCGGSIGSEKYIITAAHCKFRTNGVIFAYGTNQWKDTDNLAVASLYTSHPNYNSRTIDFDYAYVTLETDLVWSEYIQPINIVPANENSKNNNEKYGDTATTAGWGYSQHDAAGNPIVIPDDLQKLDLPLNSWDTCVGYWGDPEENPVLGRYTERMQCCGGQGSSSCMGDSGGPLMVI